MTFPFGSSLHGSCRYLFSGNRERGPGQEVRIQHKEPAGQTVYHIPRGISSGSMDMHVVLMVYKERRNKGNEV